MNLDLHPALALATERHERAHSAPTTALPFDIEATADRLADALARTAVARDQAGGHAADERELIRESGLLALTIPKSLGGLEAPWPVTYRVIRRLAHVFAFHHLQLATVLLFASDAQQARILRQTVEQRWFWGNALNPLDTRLVATRQGSGWRLDGAKSYASGSVGSDRLIVSALVRDDEAGVTARTLIGHLDTFAHGIAVREDWDSFGQRQTDSGTVTFDAVFLADEDVIEAPGTVRTPRANLRQLVSQLIMANVYLGLARGAFEAATRFTREQGKAWGASGVARAADDPYLQHRYGQLWLLVRPAELSAEAASLRLQQAFDRGPALSAQERGELAVDVAEAKVLAHRASVEVGSQLFELTGAKSTSARHGLDRFWRNARVHTLHDPVDYKLRDIGRFRLEGRVPEPGTHS